MMPGPSPPGGGLTTGGADTLRALFFSKKLKKGFTNM
nr:MAG TPA: hypothetical protein [Caudoviricetes sp.]